MMKVVLVDDEQLILNHLMKLLCTKNLPVEVVGTANDTRQALKVCKETHPDLVITDIRMGSSNGLDLCEKLKISMPYTKIIILSGHDDFNYAKRALSYNVVSYLLKPIDEQELSEKITEVYETILEESITIDKRFRLKEQIRDCLPMMKDWFFGMISLHHTAPAKLAESFDLFHIDILGSCYQVIYISLNNEAPEGTLETELGNIAAMAKTFALFIGSGTKSLYFYDVNAITIILSYPDGEAAQIHGTTIEIAEKMRQYLDFNYPKPFSIGISIPTDEITGIKPAAKDAVLASTYSFYIGYGEIICITDVELRDTNTLAPDFTKIQQEILKQLKMCNTEATRQNLRIFYLNLLQIRADISYTKNKYTELYFYLANAITQEFGAISQGRPDTSHQIRQSSNMEQIRSIVDNYAVETIETIARSRQDKSTALIEKAKHYIRSHYKENISLESIAEAVSLSPCYLSTLFSNLEQTSIKEYIIQVRIEASKILLKDLNLKIYEVAGNVGYMDSRYFSQLFRKKTGYTPGQYREFLGQS